MGPSTARCGEGPQGLRHIQHHLGNPRRESHGSTCECEARELQSRRTRTDRSANGKVTKIKKHTEHRLHRKNTFRFWRERQRSTQQGLRLVGSPWSVFLMKTCLRRNSSIGFAGDEVVALTPCRVLILHCALARIETFNVGSLGPGAAGVRGRSGTSDVEEKHAVHDCGTV